VSRLRERIQSRPPEPMKPKQWAMAGAVIGILFALGSIARGDVAPGIVGGILAGIVGGWRAARLAPAEALRTIG
jgi:hypothetical protein